MPRSSNEGKKEILQHIRKECPLGCTVLDVGAGCGTYARLLQGIYSVIDCIEIHEPYVKQFDLQKKYRHVYIGDIRKFTSETFYDLIVLGDILEHLSAADAASLVQRLPSLGKRSIISIPYLFKQGAWGGNVNETHLQPDLTPSVMKARYPALVPLYEGRVIGVYELPPTAALAPLHAT